MEQNRLSVSAAVRDCYVSRVKTALERCAVAPKLYYYCFKIIITIIIIIIIIILL